MKTGAPESFLLLKYFTTMLWFSNELVMNCISLLWKEHAVNGYRQLLHSSEYLLCFSTEERNAYGFGTT